MYKTSDLYLASALQQAGYSLRSIWKEGSRSTFEFEESSGLRQAVEDYFSGRMSLPAHGFAERIRSAKSAAINAPSKAGN